jgi:hypothetical protein
MLQQNARSHLVRRTRVRPARCGPAGRRRGRNAPNGPQGVHRVSAADPPGYRGSPPNQGRHLDVVVARCKIPQDVVFLGLDWGRAAGVHSVGRPGRREDPEGAEEASGDMVDAASEDPGWRHIDRALAAIVSTARTGSTRPRTSPRSRRPGSWTGRAVYGSAADGRSAPAMRGLEPTAPSSSTSASWRPAARGSHRGPRRIHAAPHNYATQSRHSTKPRNHAAPQLQRTPR